MKRLRWWSASALLLSGFLAIPARAQAPADGAGPATSQPAAPRREATPRRYTSSRRDAYPYSGYRTYDSSRSGYRNPGGVGRYSEYYPAGDRFQNTEVRNPVPVATFNGGSGVPTMEQQMAAQSLGVQKYNSIQQSIDRYAQPYYGFGFGFGFR